MDTKSIGQNPIQQAPLGSDGVLSKKVGDDRESLTNVPESKNIRGVDVELSSSAKSLAESKSKALEIARNTPDIRSDKVDYFKKLIASGQYKPDAGNIADGILREAVKERLSET